MDALNHQKYFSQSIKQNQLLILHKDDVLISVAFQY